MSLSQKILKLFPPETAHKIAKWGIGNGALAPGHFCHDGKPIPFFNSIALNPLGLAAGFDKNGELTDWIGQYGFGWVEVGSVTLMGGKGNPKPRLFRLGEGELLNRMGLNGDPAEVVSARLRKAYGIYGVNIAKTHDPEIVGDDAIYDVLASYKLLFDLGKYTVINISCPNTKESTFESHLPALRDLLSTLDAHRRVFKLERNPLLVKISPLASIPKIVDICLDNHVDGFVCCNTLPREHPQYGRGGLSGIELQPYSLQQVCELRTIAPKTKIIACGGIMTGQDMFRYKRAGADLFQAYTGFVSGPNAGPDFAHKVLREFYDIQKHWRDE